MPTETRAASILRQYLDVMRLSPSELAAKCDPEITGQSVRNVLDGQPAGRKVALALARLVPALEVEDLLDPKQAA